MLATMSMPYWLSYGCADLYVLFSERGWYQPSHSVDRSSLMAKHIIDFDGQIDTNELQLEDGQSQRSGTSTTNKGWDRQCRHMSHRMNHRGRVRVRNQHWG